MNKRMNELVLLAAKALDDSKDPFSKVFMVEHSITLNEGQSLAICLATGARMMVIAMADKNSHIGLIGQAMVDGT